MAVKVSETSLHYWIDQYDMRMVRVSFSNFWNGFDKADNLFVEILSESYGHVSLEPIGKRKQYDLEISSVFSSKVRYFLKKILALKRDQHQAFLHDKDFYRTSQYLVLNQNVMRRVWYTGENIRPPLDSNFDGFLSFDQDDYGGVNAYLPLWQLYFRNKMTTYISPSLGREYPVHKFLEERDFSDEPRRFVCAFINNPDPHRLRAIQALRKYGEVDIYGRSFGNFAKDKISIGSRYRFILAFENDYFPGYVTEKIFDAYAANAVPLYWGCLGKETRLNENSFIDASRFQNLDYFAFYVGNMDMSAWQKMYSEPLLVRLPDHNSAKAILIRGM